MEVPPGLLRSRDTPFDPEGSRAIEDFQPGDLVLSRDENNPDGPVVAKVVEEVFVRTGFILHLHIGGQVIRTTAEHPFWVKGKGWTPAGELQPGDLLSSHDGQWIAIEEVYDTGLAETVYNLRVADYHTYFVGDVSWGWSAWSHNVRCSADNVQESLGIDRRKAWVAGELNSRDPQRIAHVKQILVSEGVDPKAVDRLAALTMNPGPRTVVDERNFGRAAGRPNEANYGGRVGKPSVTASPEELTESLHATRGSAYKERIDQTPLHNGRWSGQRGESTFTSTDPEVFGLKVTYRNGNADLTPYSKYIVEIEDFVTKVNNYPSNPRYRLHQEADKILAARLGVTAKVIKKFRAKNKFTWHEVEDMRTLQLVPTKINMKFGHLGGISEALNK